MKSPEVRLLRKLEIGNDCWVWTGALRNGYGAIKLPERVEYCHRLAWQLTFGEIPKGQFVCHKCDNRKCCHPGHLFLGSCADNQRDMQRKGRHPGGGYFRSAGQAREKLTRSDVDAIRTDYVPGLSGVLGERFGVTRANVLSIVKWRTWT